MNRPERRGQVFVGERLAGLLEQTVTGCRFTYDPAYLADPAAPPVSLTLPRRTCPFEAPHLFAFFHGLLAEGSIKALQCQQLRLDEADHFGRLLATAHADTIGAVTVRPLPEEPPRGT